LENIFLCESSRPKAEIFVIKHFIADIYLKNYAALLKKKERKKNRKKKIEKNKQKTDEI
jgi:hypothetical protein